MPSQGGSRHSGGDHGRSTMPSRQSSSGQSHGFHDHDRTYGATRRDNERASTRHQIEDWHHGSSQALVKHKGHFLCSQTAGTTSGGRSSSSKALEKSNYGRDEYVRESPDPSPDRGEASRASRRGTSTRRDGRLTGILKSSQPSPSSATRTGRTQKTACGHMTLLGGIKEEDEYDYGGTTMQPTRGRSQAMTTYGGASKAISRRQPNSVEDDSDSDQEVIAKKRFSWMSGKLLHTKFPDLGQLLEDVLQIKPAKLEEYCESHFIRLDLSKNRADISKLLKNSTPNDREKIEKAIKRHNTQMENEHHLHGGKRPRSILEPLEDDHKAARGGGTTRGAGSSRQVISSRNAATSPELLSCKAESSRAMVSTRDAESSHDVAPTRDGDSARDKSPSHNGKTIHDVVANALAARETVVVHRPVVVGHYYRPRRFVCPYDIYDNPYYHPGWY